jgi:hypothetical protein
MAIATLCLGEFRAVAGDVTIEGKVQIAAESTRHVSRLLAELHKYLQTHSFFQFFFSITGISFSESSKKTKNIGYFFPSNEVSSPETKRIETVLFSRLHTVRDSLS